jgi:hypothetical protein
LQLIKVLAEVTNISTAILYELLLTLQHMVQNNSALKLSKLLDGVALVCISPSKRACPLTGAQTAGWGGPGTYISQQQSLSINWWFSPWQLNWAPTSTNCSNIMMTSFTEPTIQLIDTVLLCPQECYMKRSVSQLLGLLSPPSAHILTPMEAVLIYQHLSVLKFIMESISSIQDYVQEQFEEEFRFVAQEEIQSNVQQMLKSSL